MTPTELIRKALEALVQAADDSYEFASDDSDEVKVVEYARAVLELTETTNVD